MNALIIGGGAQGRVILDILRTGNRHDAIAFLDDNEQLWGGKVNGVPVLGGVDHAFTFDADTIALIVALGSPPLRLEVASRLRTKGIPM